MIYTVNRGCPICGSTVYGSEKAKYLCRRCFLLFNESYILIPGKRNKGLFHC